MPAAVTTFSGPELARLLALIKGADSVELKLTVADVAHRPTATALGLDALQAQLRQVVFFDTPELTLEKHGLVVRARRIQGKGEDSIVKLRPVAPGDVPATLRRAPGFRLEVDALPGGFVCSGTLKGAPRAGRVERVLAGQLPIRKLFSKEQRALYAAQAPAGLSLDALTVLGPILILKLPFRPADLGRRMVAELWLYPDGSRVLELSSRCEPTEAFQAAAELRSYLDERGVAVDGEQQAKTRKALEYFARAGAEPPRRSAGRLRAPA